MRTVLREFRDFIAKGNVIDLAVAVIIGAAFGKVITALVDNILMPPIGFLIGGVDFSQLAVRLNDATVISYGLFLNAVVQFVIIAAALFVVVRGVTALQHLRRKQVLAEDTPEELPTDVALLTEIRDLLAQQRTPQESAQQTPPPPPGT